MSNWKASIAGSIRTIAGTSGMKDKPDVFLAEVDSVDEEYRTCSCSLINGTSDISLNVVNLMAELNDGLLRIPTIGSTVYVLSTPNVTPWVDVFSELDKVFYVAGGSTFLLVDTGIELDGKKYGGIPKVSTTAERLKRAEQAINDTINAVKTTSIVLAASGTYPLTTNPAVAALSAIAPLTERADLENTKVQHGDGA